jgi:hypothetical protein
VPQFVNVEYGLPTNTKGQIYEVKIFDR